LELHRFKKYQGQLQRFYDFVFRHLFFPIFSSLFLSEKELGLQVTISLKANLPALQTKDNMFKFWATT